MRLTTTLFPLLAATIPSVTAAQQSQAPLAEQVKGWWAKATEAASNIAAAAPNPASAGAAALASTQVQRITLANRKEVLAPGAATSHPGVENWLIFVTGGNRTCLGHCERAEAAWNRSVPALATSRHQTRPHLGLIDCEADPVLCGAWVVAPPALIQFLVPQPAADQSAPATTTFRYKSLNATGITSEEITKLHTAKEFEKVAPYVGPFHPFDGFLAKTDLNVPMGYVTWAAGRIPSWAFMIGVSLFSRTFITRRVAPQPQARPQGGAAPAPVAR